MAFDIKRDTPFTVLGTHDGLDTALYRVTVNGVVNQEVPIAQVFSNGVVSIPFGLGLSIGSYTINVFAVSSLGEVSDDDPDSECILTVSPKKPSKVSNIRVTVS